MATPFVQQCPWIKVKDFEETALWVSVENVSTQTVIERGEGAELLALDAHGVTLQLPPQSCARGHLLELSFGKQIRNLLDLKSTPRFSEELEATAKVVETENIDIHRFVVTLKFYQFDKEAWLKLIADFSARMNELNTRLRSVRE